MRSALVPILLSDPMPWAFKAPYAWDFLKDRSRFAGGYKGSLSNTPGWSYTRSDAQTAYAQTAAGVLVPFATGVLRRTDKGVLIEGSRSNLALWSDDWTNAAWTKTTCTAALDQTGPDNVANSATSLTATAGNATVLQSITSGSATRAASVYIKRIAGSGNIQMTVDGGAGWTTLTVTSSWTQVAITQAAVTNPNFGLRIVTNGDAVAVKFGMVESAGFQSSPIPTTTASATRAADVLTVPVSGIDYPLTLFAEWEKNGDDSVNLYQRVIEIGRAAATDQALIYHRAVNNDTKLYATSGSVTQADLSVGTSSLNTTRKMAARYATNDFTASLGGAAVVSDTSGSVPAAPQNVYFGYQPGGNVVIFGYLRRIAIWTRALTDSELQTVSM